MYCYIQARLMILYQTIQRRRRVASKTNDDDDTTSVHTTPSTPTLSTHNSPPKVFTHSPSTPPPSTPPPSTSTSSTPTLSTHNSPPILPPLPHPPTLPPLTHSVLDVEHVAHTPHHLSPSQSGTTSEIKTTHCL